MRLKVFVAVGMLSALVPVGAQEIGAQERIELLKAQLDTEKRLAEKITVEGMQERMTVQARFTAGAPYSGEAISESVQVLADGNRISKKSVTRIYRDSEGRTRRETIGADGQVSSISISDPVAGVSYVLNPLTKTAARNGVMIITPSGVSATYAAGAAARVVGGRTTEGEAIVQVKDKEAAEARARTVGGGRGAGSGAETVFSGSVGAGGGGGGFGVTHPVALPGTVMTPGKSTVEDLGQQVVEGVMATGSRTTTVIDAGTIGNERPIQIISEQWTATDLQLLVATKHSDPRAGETTYRLTNITQAEQPRSLFELPSDYTLKESTILRAPALDK